MQDAAHRAELGAPAPPSSRSACSRATPAAFSKTPPSCLAGRRLSSRGRTIQTRRSPRLGSGCSRWRRSAAPCRAATSTAPRAVRGAAPERRQHHGGAALPRAHELRRDVRHDEQVHGRPHVLHHVRRRMRLDLLGVRALTSSGRSTPSSSSSSSAKHTSGALSSCGLMACRYVATSPTITRVTASIKNARLAVDRAAPFSKDLRSSNIEVITSSCPNPCRRLFATMYEMVRLSFAWLAVVVIDDGFNDAQRAAWSARRAAACAPTPRTACRSAPEVRRPRRQPPPPLAR